MDMKNTLRHAAIYVLDHIISSVCIMPNIADKEETVRKIAEERCSISRFGDGDLALIFGKPEGYQKYDPALAQRLREVLRFNGNDKLLIGLSPSVFVSKKYLYPKYRVKYLLKIKKLLDRKKQYYNTDISRFYRSSEDGKQELDYIDLLKQLWNGRDLLIVEGEKTRMGVGNDLFDNANSIRRILCPAENAYSRFDEIYMKITELASKEDLILMALGPTATLLAHDLFLDGYQAVDIGHVDISYEWFLRGVRNPSERIVIPGKYTNEATGGSAVKDCIDPKYLSQIIATVD